LDLDPGELAVGLNPLRVPLLAVEDPDAKAQVAAAVYLADTAENGAGYATELGDPGTFGAMLKTALNDVVDHWQTPEHQASCDFSCPDCLRSYDNSRRHALLDWRLAIDMLELAASEALTIERSLPQDVALFEPAAHALQGAKAELVEGVPSITRGKRCVLLAHPLWRIEPDWLNDTQAEAQATAEGNGLAVVWHDVRKFRLNPLWVWPDLAS
jgi:DEAD/DEAH box helicase domain-containing protein